MIKGGFIADNLNTFLFGALAFSVSSAWNSALQNYFKEHKYLKDKGPWLYALFISTFAIICAFLLHEATVRIKNMEKFLRKKNTDEDDEYVNENNESSKLQLKNSSYNKLNKNAIISCVYKERKGKHVTLKPRAKPFHQT